MATTVSPRIAHWTDKRAKHKSRASARLETIKRQTVWRAAHLSAAAARASGSPRYVGHPCKRGHRGERFTFGGGGCVECARLGAERRRREVPSMRLLGVIDTIGSLARSRPMLSTPADNSVLACTCNSAFHLQAQIRAHCKKRRQNWKFADRACRKLR